MEKEPKNNIDETPEQKAVSDELKKMAEDVERDDNPLSDPLIQETERVITAMTNRAMESNKSGTWGKDVKAEASGSGYSDVWDREFKRISKQQWESFVKEHPEKAEKYKDSFESIGNALKRRNREKTKN